MVKHEGHDKALDMYLKAGGNINIKAIAKAVGANPLTVGRWKKKDNWDAKLKEVIAAPAVSEKKPRGARGIFKKDVFDKAVRIFSESGGTISNVQLGKESGVSTTTIAEWKNRPEWNEAVSVPVVSEPERPKSLPEPSKPVVTRINLGAVIAPQDLMALNERLRSMLQREYLTSADLEHLSNAKLSLLEAAGVYMGLLEDVGERD